MNNTELTEDLCQLHIEYASTINKVFSTAPSYGEDGLLLWLSYREGITFATDIAKHFSLSTGRVANLLKSLEKKGMLLRKKDNNDLRKVTVVLTDQGKDYASQVYSDMFIKHQNLLLQLGDEDSKHLVRIVHKLLDMASQNRISI